jgi:hypothetical protein
MPLAKIELIKIGTPQKSICSSHKTAPKELADVSNNLSITDSEIDIEEAKQFSNPRAKSYLVSNNK